MTQWGINPAFQFLPINSGRSSVPYTNDRGRFTSMIMASANGAQLPAAFIIKCASKNKQDQRNITVIKTLNQQDGYKESDGWFMGMWERTLKGKKHYRPYLLNEIDGRLIFAQNYAYMDYAGAVMWCDLVVEPARRASGRQKWLLVWDNHKSHLDEEVISIFAAAGIILRGLPVNMSDLLQGYSRQQLHATSILVQIYHNSLNNPQLWISFSMGQLSATSAAAAPSRCICTCRLGN